MEEYEGIEIPQYYVPFKRNMYKDYLIRYFPERTSEIEKLFEGVN